MSRHLTLLAVPLALLAWSGTSAAATTAKARNGDAAHQAHTTLFAGLSPAGREVLHRHMAPLGPAERKMMLGHLAQMPPAARRQILQHILPGHAAQAHHAAQPAQAPAKVAALEIGQPVPDFSVTDLSGKTQKLSDLQKASPSGVVALTYWCSFCQSCR